jgi:hypothetical protein
MKFVCIITFLVLVAGCGQNPASTSPDLRPASQKTPSSTISESEKGTNMLRQPAGTNDPVQR